MAQEVWSEIQATESKAATIIEDAKKHDVEAKRKAKEEAAAAVKSAEEKAIQAGEKLLQENLKKFEQEKSEQFEKIGTEIIALTAEAEKKLSEAAKMIVEKVVK